MCEFKNKKPWAQFHLEYFKFYHTVWKQIQNIDNYCDVYYEFVRTEISEKSSERNQECDFYFRLIYKFKN